MNIEKIIAPIENDVERDRELKNKLCAIQIHYVNKKYKQAHERNPEEKFSTFFANNTAVIKELTDIYNYELDIKEDKEREKYITPIFEALDSIYTMNNDEERREELLQQRVLREFELIPTKKKFEENRGAKQENRVGLFEYEIEAKNCLDMKKFGFNEWDEFLKIHIPNFYKSGEKQLTPGVIRDSMEKLSELVLEKFPYISAVIGQSWLLSTPIAKRLGFKETDRIIPAPLTSMSTWAQFIDQEGNISKERLDKFIKTGEFPYKSVSAFISIEELLSRYLPKDKRGDVVLKDIRPGFISYKERLKKYRMEVEKVKGQYSNFLSDPTQTSEEFINSFKDVSVILEEIGLKSDIIELFRLAKKEQISFEQLREKYGYRFSEFDKKFEEEILKKDEREKAEQYIDKVIHIE